MHWPWKRFERFYEAAQKRVLIERLEARKEAMIAALWSNSNYDSQEQGQDAPRNAVIEEIEENFAEAVNIIMNGTKPEEEEAPDTYGFFAAGKRGEDKIYKVLEDPDKDKTVQEVIDYTKGIDQG